ncbi:MAG: hypothetical protein COC15_02685 [Legionellales bacterium]|nr:MAG: hypothetical protein COC15_02685 [Legionellales bacterium]
MAVVPQHVILFDDTIYNNIAYACTHKVSLEQVIKAAKMAHAWEFIKELPQGMETSIGENGLNLSGGQRQRIAIARAILKDAPILILDEATSALDQKSEEAVQKAIDSLCKNRTVLVIAHRLSTIKSADNILVLHDGNIVETGTHTELLKSKGHYAKLLGEEKFVE